MKKPIWPLALACSLITTASLAAPTWTYEGAAGAEHWAELDPSYAACGGKNQSPVNITGTVDAQLPPLVFDYKAPATDVVNNGHTVQTNIAAGSSIEVDARRFALKQFHAHAPSENVVDGKSYPLEIHFVHADESGNLAVVAIFFEEGNANPALETLWKTVPESNASRPASAPAATVSTLLPTNRDYYRFSGSLTTPPCTEGVRWLVMKTPVTASAGQIEAFRHAVHHANNRPVQPLNARLILR